MCSERGDEFFNGFNESNILDEISTRLDLSRNVFSESPNNLYLKRISDEMLAKRAVKILDAQEAGNHVYHSNIKLRNLDKRSVEKAINCFKNCQNAIWISGFAAPWDIEVVFIAKNLRRFKEFWQRLLSFMEEFIEDYKISLSVKRHHTTSERISKKKEKNLSISIFGFDPGTEKLENPDIEILAEISRTGNPGSSHIAEQIYSRKDDVKERLENLEMAGIV